MEHVVREAAERHAEEVARMQEDMAAKVEEWAAERERLGRENEEGVRKMKQEYLDRIGELETEIEELRSASGDSV